jgi:hypothetical protein
MAVMRQMTKRTAMAIKRVRVDRATVKAKERRVTATTVVVMMANGTKVSARPPNNQLRGSGDNNSEGDKEDEGSKGDGDGGYGDDLTRGITAAAMAANDNEDSVSPHSTTINLMQQWEQQKQ